MRRKKEKAQKKRVSNNGETSASDDAPPPPSPESMLVKQFNSSPMPFSVENGVNGSSPRSPADEEEEGGRNVELRKSVSKRKAWQDKKCVVPPPVVHAVALILGATCSIPGFVEATESAVSLLGIGCPQVGDGPLRAMPHRQALALRGAYGVRPRAREVAGSGGSLNPPGRLRTHPHAVCIGPLAEEVCRPPGASSRRRATYPRATATWTSTRPRRTSSSSGARPVRAERGRAEREDSRLIRSADS